MSILGSTDFGDPVLVVTVDHDPTVVVTDVPKGSLIIDANKDWWRKLDDGSSTNVQAVGGGGTVAKAIDHTWEGDGTVSRVIDLGDDYDLVLIYLEETKAHVTAHVPHAYAFRGAYGGYYKHSSQTYWPHEANSPGVFQGKLTGGDVNKIKLGTNTGTAGTNTTGWTFRAVGLKFASME